MVAPTIEIISSHCVSRVILRFMHSRETAGVMIEPIPTRVGGIKIYTAVPIGERRGGLACKIAKWRMGVLRPLLGSEVEILLTLHYYLEKNSLNKEFYLELCV